MKKSINKTQFIRLIAVDSTNKYAMQWLRTQEAEHRTLNTECRAVIIAENQYAGKGLSDNKWVSETNKNITLSIIEHPLFLPVERQFMLNEAISLGIIDFINKTAPKLNLKIKWPNDIYINDKKVAGILIENFICASEFQSAIIGIGLNVNQEIFRSDAPNPTSLKLETGKDFNLDECVEFLIKVIDKRYNMLKHEQTDKLLKDYINNLYRFGKYYDYKCKNTFISAKIIGISQFGQLILKKKDNTYLNCNFKEVEFIS